MPQWSQRRFNSLKDIAEYLCHVKGYKNFARYCLLRDQGLRKTAMQELAAFINQCHLSPLPEQRQIASELAELNANNGDGILNALLPQPLWLFVSTVLKSWCAENPQIVEPYRWCAIVCNEAEYFKRALKILPSDELSLSYLAQYALGDVDFATHHLYEGSFIGDEASALTALAQAASYTAKMPLGELKSSLEAEINYNYQLIKAWQQYQSAKPNTEFPEWCAQQGYRFSFTKAFYINKNQT